MRKPIKITEAAHETIKKEIERRKKADNASNPTFTVIIDEMIEAWKEAQK